MKLVNKAVKYLEEQPEAETREVMRDVGCSMSTVYKAMKRMQETGVRQDSMNRKVEKIQNRRNILVSMTITNTDVLVLKVVSAETGMVGTLGISSEGLWFTKPNGKKVSDRMITWSIMERLAEVGLV